jgi:hypothetical protein
MIIKKGDYAFTGEDVRPHRWALKIKKSPAAAAVNKWFWSPKGKDPDDEYTFEELERLAYTDYVALVMDKPKLEQVLGTPAHYYVADNGSFACMWPRPDKDYELELVQLPDESNSEKSA